MKFEEKLAQAFKETHDERAKRLMKIEKKHRFSLSYKLWERKMLRDLRRNRYDKHWTLRKARYAVTAMIAAISLFIGGTAYAAVIISRRFAFDDTLYYSKLLIETHPSDKTTFEEYYGLPEEDGWELTYYDFMHLNTMLKLKYNRGDTMVIFCQRIIHEGDMRHINTKEANIEMLALYSENDGFLVTPKEGDASIFWIYDGYFFEIVGDFDKEEAIKLAYSTIIIDLPPNF